MEEHILDKIEAYLNGELTKQEEKEFDLEIEQNPELAAAVDNFGVANDAIELLIEDNLRAELNQLKTKETSSSNIVSINKKKQHSRMRSLRTYLAAAASVALLLGFFGMNWVGNNYSNESLKQAYYEDGYSLPNVRSGDSVIHPFSEGLTAYEAENFTAAILFLEGIQENNPRYSEAQFYLAHAYFKNKEFSKANRQFQKVIDLNDSRYIENAEWYKILTQLSVDENVDQLLLNKIVENKDHLFNNKAVSLQSELDSFWRKFVF